MKCLMEMMKWELAALIRVEALRNQDLWTIMIKMILEIQKEMKMESILVQEIKVKQL